MKDARAQRARFLLVLVEPPKSFGLEPLHEWSAREVSLGLATRDPRRAGLIPLSSCAGGFGTGGGGAGGRPGLSGQRLP